MNWIWIDMHVEVDYPGEMRVLYYASETGSSVPEWTIYVIIVSLNAISVFLDLVFSQEGTDSLKLPYLRLVGVFLLLSNPVNIWFQAYLSLFEFKLGFLDK